MIHTTNYINTFIEIAEDCKNKSGVKPPHKEEKTIAEYHYDLIANNPYRYTSDDILFMTYASKNQIEKSRMKDERAKFFSKGQACLRSSSLTKTYGWGIHLNNEGMAAIYSADSEEYKKYSEDKKLNHLKAMRNKRQV
jgi:hypothetical protein